jgi:hypothetical protein
VLDEIGNEAIADRDGVVMLHVGPSRLIDVCASLRGGFATDRAWPAQAELALHLELDRRLDTTVLDLGGRPVAGCRIKVLTPPQESLAGRSALWEGETDASGRVSVPHLQVAVPEGFSLAGCEVGVDELLPEPQVRPLVSGDDGRSEVVFRVPRPTRLSVGLKTRSGVPVVGPFDVSVRAAWSSGELSLLGSPRAWAFDAARGGWSGRGVEGAVAVVRAEIEGLRLRVTSAERVQLRAVGRSSGDIPRVSLSTDVCLLRFRMRPRGVGRASLRDLRFEQLEANRDLGSLSASGDDGEVWVGVSPGDGSSRMRVRGGGPGGRQYGCILELSRLRGGEWVDLGDVWVDAQDPVVHGTVRDEVGRPVVGAEVRLDEGDGGLDAREVLTDEAGRYSIHGPVRGLHALVIWSERSGEVRALLHDTPGRYDVVLDGR